MDRRACTMARGLLAGVLAVSLPAGSARATDANWVGPATGMRAWLDGGNWGPAVPDGPGDGATFADLAVTDDLHVDLGGTSVTVGELRFTGAAFEKDLYLESGSMVFDAGASAAALLDMALVEPDRDRPPASLVVLDADVALHSDLLINQNNDHSAHGLRFEQAVTASASETLTVAGPGLDDLRFNIDQPTVAFAGDVTASAVNVTGAAVAFDRADGYATVNADIALSDGRLSVAAATTMLHNGRMDITGGVLAIGAGGVLDTTTPGRTVHLNNATLLNSGKIMWWDANQSAYETFELRGSGGSLLRLVSADEAGFDEIQRIVLDGSSTLSASRGLLVGLTFGGDLLVEPGSMICHRSMAPGGGDSPGNLPAAPTVLYGVSVDLEGADGVVGRDRSVAGGYTPWTLEVGSEGSTPWLGLGGDTSASTGQPGALVFGAAADINGNGADVVEIHGDSEIRNTTAYLKDAHYHTTPQGAMEVGARLTGNAGLGDAHVVRVTGPGLTALANPTNDVECTWRVEGGILKAYLFGDTPSTNTQDTLGHPGNDIELDAAVFTAMAAGKSNEADLEPGRTLTMLPGGGTIYLNDNDINWTQFGADQPFNFYAFQTAVNASGLYEPGKSTVYNNPVSPYDGPGLQTLNMPADGQLAGTGRLTVEGNGTLRVLGSNPGFSGEVEVLPGATLHAERADSLGVDGGSGAPILLGLGAVLSTGFTPTAADFARVGGAGTYAIGGTYAGAVDLSASELWLHTSKGGAEHVAVSNVIPNASAGFRFGGAGGVLFVEQGLAGQAVTVRGPGVTVLAADNTGIASLDFSAGGLGIGHVNALGSGVTVDVTDGQSLMFANGLHAASPGKGYTINLAGGQVGFVGDFTLTSLSQLGAMVASSGTQILGIGAPGDTGTVYAGQVAIGTNPAGRPIRVTKYGDSTLDLRGATANTYAGYTYIHGGTVLVSDGANLGSGAVAIYEGGRLATADADVTFSSFVGISGLGGLSQVPGTEPEVHVPGGLTLTCTNDFYALLKEVRLRKTGGGTLSLAGITAMRTPFHTWGLTLDEGEVELSRLPYYLASENGMIVLRGGDLHCLAGTGGALRDDPDYGFLGIILTEDATSTIRVDNGGLFKLTGTLNSPRNRLDGTMIIEGADETSAGSGDWGEVLFAYIVSGGGAAGGVGFAADSRGTIELRSGLLTTESSVKPRVPKNPQFTLKLSGGKADLGGYEATYNGHLVFDDGNAATPAPQVARLDVAGSGTTTWRGRLRKVDDGTLSLGRSAASVTQVEPGSSLAVEAGTVRVAGGTDPLGDGADTVGVEVLGGALRFDVSGGYIYDGGIASDGLLRVSRPTTLTGAITSPGGRGRVSIDAGSTLTVPTILDACSIDLAADATLLLGPADATTGALSLAAGAQVVLDGGALTVGGGLEPNDVDLLEAELMALAAPAWAGGPAGLTDASADAMHVVGVAPIGDAVLVRLTIPGDSDLDFDVDRDDLLALADGFAGVARWSRGDFNFDGAVNALDYALLKRNYGRTYVPPAPPAPEPTALALLLGSAGLVVRRRARRVDRRSPCP